ncbi:MAG: ferritin [Ignavibacteriaceae bacterium]|nr:MAG: ferritin [Ignavibacteriaceae bacterium]MBV6444765.1 Bacterial non-heme ferritin [Ignavibacteriaceae bacterium]MBW7873338.1 ferritin [Ignavibacteria bacterium]MBZ0197850.1 ferritin [Ignavibacteriaceae bacterium]WKZ71780.1 MAG: ferritin [Ignavibacteriaceae bacterium]
MLSEKMEKAFNEQINKELFSEYLYRSMVAYFESLSLSGFAKYYHVQADEEHEHAMKIFEYIHTRGGRVVLEAIEKPKTEWNGPLDALKDAYNHEKFITGSIHSLVDLAIELKDHASNQFLQWYVEEQVEEEENAVNLIDKLEMIGESKNSLYLFDRDMGKRTK